MYLCTDAMLGRSATRRPFPNRSSLICCSHLLYLDPIEGGGWHQGINEPGVMRLLNREQQRTPS